MIKYFPVEINTSTFGGRIRHYRYTRRITPREFGRLIYVDASTVWD
jgi:hypothetical protein